MLNVNNLDKELKGGCFGWMEHVFGQSGQMLTNNLAHFFKSFDTGTHACAEHYSTTQLLNPSRQDC